MFFRTDDAKIRTICEVCKSCTQERRKDARRTAIRYWFANSCNGNKYLTATNLRQGFRKGVISTEPLAPRLPQMGWFQLTPSQTRYEKQFRKRQTESRRCQNVSRSKCVIFVFGCPGKPLYKYIFLIYILYRPLTALSFFILTHFDLDPF